MAFDSFRCEGYKAFLTQAHVALRPVTVFFGKNNSGKTTLARMPIFLTASLADPNFYSLRSGDLTFGSSFQGLGSPDVPHPRIAYELSWDGTKRVGSTLQYFIRDDGTDSVEPISLSIDSSTIETKIDPQSASSPDDLSVLLSLDPSMEKVLRKNQSELNALRERIIHIRSARPQIQSAYIDREPTSWSVEEAPYHLASDRDLLDVVVESMRMAVGTDSLSVDKAAFAFRLTARDQRRLVDVAAAGRGTQAALPVITMLEAVASGKSSSVMSVVEEPEAHLHPSAHGPMADIVIKASKKAQVVVETHSENFILRLRRRVAEGTLTPDAVGLYYITEDHLVNLIDIDSQGGATNWPAGVFESDIDEAEAIVDAKLAIINARETER